MITKQINTIINLLIVLNKFKQSNKLILLDSAPFMKNFDNLVISYDKNSVFSGKSLGSISMADKTDQDTQKNFTTGKTRLIEHSSELQNQSSSEQNYDKLLDIFQCLKTKPGKEDESNNLDNKFSQFSAGELLQISDKSLWKSSKCDKILSSYCKTLTSLSQKNFQFAFISTPEEQFIGVNIGAENNYNVQVFEPEPMAIQFFEQRAEFLALFEKKLSSDLQKNRLSQLSKEIIFLYSEYKKLRKRILQIVKNKKEQVEQNRRGQQGEEKLKKLTKELRQLRKNKMKKQCRRRK